MSITLIVSFIISFVLVWLIIYTARHHKNITLDHDTSSIQKYHTVPTPRIGGVAIYIGFLITVLLLHYTSSFNDHLALKILLSGSLAFLIGVVEDITKKVSPRIRLLAFVITTFLAIYVIHSMPIIYSTDFIALNNLITHYNIIGIAFSLFAVVGLINSYNIIDGYNGLSSTTAIISLIALYIVAYFLSDTLVMHLLNCFIGAILGFLVFNYPSGKIFLGDGGAYFIGFIIANFCIYIAHAHIGSVSPYVFLLVNIYPITEMGVSMIRRKLIHKTKSTEPDNKHLHQLVFHKLVPGSIKNKNACVMPIMLIFILPQVILSVIFYTSTFYCLLFMAIYFVYYVSAYIFISSLDQINE